ncbi:hypothetical protein [Bradyrhizobium sp. sGM-13]|nr:hypothetical protein [Bradyrhizobium sp. sGM-13]
MKSPVSAGTVAGTLAIPDDLSFWLDRRVRYFYVHPTHLRMEKVRRGI